jgi:iron complex outermembrane recepter protein
MVPPTAARRNAGQPWAAVLRAVDSSRINMGGARASGVDVGMCSDFHTPFGRLSPDLRATWFDTFRSADIPGQPMTDRVNVASEFGSILKWRAILSLRWTRGPYAIAPFVRYTPSYDDAVAGVRTGRWVESQTLFDLHGSVDLGRLLPPSSIWNGFKLSGGAMNLFDTEPSFAQVGGTSDFDFSQGDPKARTYYLRIERKL